MTEPVKSVIHNFNAGPSVLPKEVFEEASRAVIDFNNTGLSILEIGHRTPLFQEVMDEARALAKELMNLDDDHEVLFLHGGASTQFMQMPMNLLNENEIAAYSDTGVWASKAIKEAKLFGSVDVVCSSKDKITPACQKSFKLIQLQNIFISQPTTPSTEPNGRIFHCLTSFMYHW